MTAAWTLKANPAIAGAMREAAARGLALSAEHVLGEARKTVPLEEGTLERSGDVVTDPENLRAAVVFDTPYAVRQHEDMTARHDPGRSAKYLENALNSETDTVREIIAATIRGEF